MKIEYLYESSYLDMPIFDFYGLAVNIGTFLIAFYLIKNNPKGKNYIIIAVSIFLLMTSYGIYEKFEIRKAIKYAFNYKSYMVIEGIVQEFVPMPKSGHKSESFKVSGTLFEVLYTGDYPKAKTLFYTLTKNRNGPVKKNGQYIKIYYISIDGKNKIIKMWVYSRSQNKRIKGLNSKI